MAALQPASQSGKPVEIWRMVKRTHPRTHAAQAQTALAFGPKTCWYFVPLPHRVLAFRLAFPHLVNICVPATCRRQAMPCRRFSIQADRVLLMQMGQLTIEVVGSSAFGESAAIPVSVQSCRFTKLLHVYQVGKASRLVVPQPEGTFQQAVQQTFTASCGSRCLAGSSYVLFVFPQ